eukprot:Opistho-2@56362
MASITRAVPAIALAGRALSTSASVAAAPAHASQDVSSATAKDTSFYELRWYDVKPAHFRDFLELTKEKIHLRTAVSPLVGYWTCELGGLNQTVHIWKYDSFAQRTAVRAMLGQNDVWMASYMAKMTPWLNQQTNSVMYSLLDKSLPDTVSGATYELRSHRLRAGAVPQWKASFAELLEGGEYPAIGAWMNDFGSGHTVHELLQYPSLDHRRSLLDRLGANTAHRTLQARLADLVQETHSKHLSPLPFSPLR